MCSSCLKEIKLHQGIYEMDSIPYYVLYEYNLFLERLFFQYKEQRDLALAPLFLDGYESIFEKWVGNFPVVCPCSSDAKRMERGFEPVLEMFHPYDIYSPYYKTKNIKQSEQSALHRKEIEHVIEKKTLYPMKDGPYVLVDDVLTTGSTIKRCIDLLPIQKVFVLAAHPLWIRSHQENKVVKRSWIW